MKQIHGQVIPFCPSCDNCGYKKDEGGCLKPSVEIKSNVILSMDEYAIRVNDTANANLLVEDCVFISNKISFWRSPLLWLAHWRMKREYHKHSKVTT